MSGNLHSKVTYTLDPIPAPWGDYGAMLYHGMSMHAPRRNGSIQLERTGPDIFPITFPIDVIITAECRALLERSELSGLTFRSVIKHRIVDLDWSAWDITEEEPPSHPESGDPADYILERPHSGRAAAEMPELWELVASDRQSDDIHYLPGTRVIALSQKGKTWFEANLGDYVSIKQS